MGFAELMLTDLAGAPRTNGGPGLLRARGEIADRGAYSDIRPARDPGRNRPLDGPAAVSDFIRSATPGCRKATSADQAGQGVLRQPDNLKK